MSAMPTGVLHASLKNCTIRHAPAQQPFHCPCDLPLTPLCIAAPCYVSREFEMISSPGKQWDQNSRLRRHCRFPRLPYYCIRALVTPRIHREHGKATRPDVRLTILACTCESDVGSPCEHGRCLGRALARRRAQRRRYHGKMMMRIAWLSQSTHHAHLAKKHRIG